MEETQKESRVSVEFGNLGLSCTCYCLTHFNTIHILVGFFFFNRKKKEDIIFLAHEPAILWQSSYHKTEFQMDYCDFLYK